MYKGIHESSVAAEGGSEEAVRDAHRSVPIQETGDHIDTSHEFSTVKSTRGEPPDRHYLEDMFNQSANAMIAVDEHFHVFDLNPAARARFGVAPDSTLDQRCLELLKCRNLNGTLLCGTSNCPLARVLSQKTPIPGEEFIIGPSLEASCEYSMAVTPVHNGATPGALFTARDMSSLKVANQVRTNFVSMVSHELRTPLNSVHGFIDLLMQGHMGELLEEQRKYLGYAQEGVQQLMTIVEDILFMTRSDSGQFEMKPHEVNLRVLAKQVVTSLKLEAVKAAVVLEKDIPTPTPLLYADQQRMKQVLNNLVINAIKFTPPGGTVTIRARPYNDRFVMISVVDTGYGIASEDQQHIFERFYQSNHALQSKMGGYGLGLPIAKLIVEQHGGEIGFDTRPREGTTFYFTAPLYAGQDKASY